MAISSHLWPVDSWVVHFSFPFGCMHTGNVHCSFDCFLVLWTAMDARHSFFFLGNVSIAWFPLDTTQRNLAFGRVPETLIWDPCRFCLRLLFYGASRIINRRFAFQRSWNSQSIMKANDFSLWSTCDDQSKTSKQNRQGQCLGWTWGGEWIHRTEKVWVGRNLWVQRRKVTKANEKQTPPREKPMKMHLKSTKHKAVQIPANPP